MEDGDGVVKRIRWRLSLRLSGIEFHEDQFKSEVLHIIAPNSLKLNLSLNLNLSLSAVFYSYPTISYFHTALVWL